MIFMGLPAALGCSIFAVVRGTDRVLSITALVVASLEVILLVLTCFSSLFIGVE